MASAAKKKIKVTLKKSLNKKLRAHQACVRGLGLHRIGESVDVIDTPCVRGMINRVHYLVAVEEG